MRQILGLCACFLLFLGVTTCTTSKGKPQSETMSTTAMSDKLHVSFSGDHGPKTLIAQLAEYDVQNRGRTSRTENKYLLVFNPQKIAPEELLSKINAMPEVVEAKLVPVSSQ